MLRRGEGLTARIVLQHPQISNSIRNHEPDLSLTDEEISRHDMLVSVVLSEKDKLEGILLRNRKMRGGESASEARGCRANATKGRRTWKTANQTLFSTSPMRRRFLRVRMEVT